MTTINSTAIEGVPADFPRGRFIPGSLPGAQPKVALVEVDGCFYAEGQTPEDVQAQHKMCEDRAHPGVDYCRRKMAEGVVKDEGAGEGDLGHDSVQVVLIMSPGMACNSTRQTRGFY